MLAAWDAKIGAWRSLLESGPQSLSHRQIVALAGEHARAFLTQHEDDPFEAPAELQLGSGTSEAGDEVLAVGLRGLSGHDKKRLKADLLAFLRADEGQRGPLGLSLLARYPAFQAALKLDLQPALERMHGGDTDKALAGRDLHVSAEIRGLLNLEMLRMVGAARRGLERRKGGDYGPVPELEAAPEFVVPKQVRTPEKVTFEAIISCQARKRLAGAGSKPMPEKSIQKYKRLGEDFARSRGSTDATTVKVSEVEEWMDSMVSAGEIGNRSIADRIVSLGTIINWGKRQREHREAMASAESVSGRVELPSYVEKPASDTSYTLEEARRVLQAARKELDASKRWLPWVCLYGGLRISEAEGLRREDFFQAEGEWFFRVTSAGKRSLKTANSERVVPVHPALVEEGLLEWLEERPKGQLFRPSAYSYMGRWVRSKTVGITRKGVSPNHGLRHLFVALCRRDGVNSEAAEYLAGHATAKVHAKYGSTEVMLPGLAVEMRKIKPLLGVRAVGGRRGERVEENRPEVRNTNDWA
jgi:integrase